MFTGLVRRTGTVRSVRDTEGGRCLEIESALDSVAVGASVSHSGVCLTVAERLDDRTWRVDVVPETLHRTTLGGWTAGTLVNLEPSLRMGDAMDGHFVFGHVDATVEIMDIAPEGRGGYRLRLALPPALEPLVALKGSVALDGISLTVAALDADRFDVAIVPHTWEATTLRARAVGERLNLEVDMLARYIARNMEFK